MVIKRNSVIFLVDTKLYHISLKYVNDAGRSFMKLWCIKQEREKWREYEKKNHYGYL